MSIQIPLINKRLTLSNTIELIKNLSRKTITITNENYEDPYIYDTQNNGKVSKIENITTMKLKFRKSDYWLSKYGIIAGYDESIKRVSSIEGDLIIYSHALTYMINDNYIPIVDVKSFFLTNSQKFSKIENAIKNTDEAKKKIYVDEKVYFLRENVIDNTLLIIDGPLIAGDWYIEMINLIINDFISNGIIPVFIVKNSLSNMITTHILDTNEFNNDLHWASEILGHAERTFLASYTDTKRNSKIFCYIKPFEKKSPIRIEFHKKYLEILGEKKINEIIDFVYYMILANGNHDIQPRIVRISELYARESIKILSPLINNLKSKLILTINDERFGD